MGLPKGSAVTRAPAIGAAWVVLAVGALGFWRPMAGPGYESSLGAGVVAPSAAAIAVAVEIGARRLSPSSSYALGLAVGGRLALLALATTLVHGLRVGFCDVWSGIELFLLGPGMGLLLAGAWGSGAGLVARRARAGWARTACAVALGVLGPVGSILLGLALFYATPMVFAYDPFVGYFSGAIYDTVLDSAGLYSYRAASLLTLVAAYAMARHLVQVESPKRNGTAVVRIRWPRASPRWLLPFGAGCAAVSIATVAYGPTLGHWQTASTIASELGGRAEMGPCRIVYPRAMRDRDAQLFARDCSGHAAALTEWFGRAPSPPVTVFLFADAAQKRRLMGAAAVSIAKPWRREIYLHDQGYPHGSLGHELAHVWAGAVGRGPFAIAGQIGGWLPDPGLIEGVAVAAAPERGDLTHAEWAKAMRDIEVLPPLRELFGLSFFGRHSRTAYTAAGAFVGYVHGRFGAEAIRRWYGGESLREVTGDGLATLERAWHAELDTVELDEAALVQARARFDRPGVLGRRCPHVVDANLVAAGALHAMGEGEACLSAYDEALQLDPGNAAGLLGRTACLETLERDDEVQAALQRVAADPEISQRVRDGAHERLGDLALRAGELAEARRWYALAREHAVDEGRLRTLDVKRYVCDHPLGRAAIIALLVGSDRRGPNQVEALDRIGAWRASDPDDGVPDYLFARQYLDGRRYQLAAERLDDALGKRIDLERVHAEALRLRLRAACALGDADAARAAFASYAARPGLPEARRQAAQHLLGRCTLALP